MFYNIQFVKNGLTVDKQNLTDKYETDVYVFLTIEDALAWIKSDATPTAP
jgi:hypothetical protein